VLGHQGSVISKIICHDRALCCRHHPRGDKDGSGHSGAKKSVWYSLPGLRHGTDRNLLDQVWLIFEIEPDIDLDIMRPNQALTTLTARLLLALNDVLEAEKPDVC
jgi:hypothetical protein